MFYAIITCLWTIFWLIIKKCPKPKNRHIFCHYFNGNYVLVRHTPWLPQKLSKTALFGQKKPKTRKIAPNNKVEEMLKHA